MALRWLARLGWLLMAIMAVYLAAITFVYYSFRSDIYFLLEKQDIVNDPLWRTAFYLHITGGILCLSTGIFQFSEKLRKKKIQLHRLLGKIYMVGVLLLGAPAGLYMAFWAEGGWFARIGFSTLSILWFLSTWKGLKAIMKRKIQQHLIWMKRSYALTFAAVTLRLWVPILGLVFRLSQEQILWLTPWLSWMLNLIIVEIIIVMSSSKKTYKVH